MSSRLTRPEKNSSHEESLTVAMFMDKELCDHAMNAWWPCLLESRDILFLSNENIFLSNENIFTEWKYSIEWQYILSNENIISDYIKWKLFLLNENIFCIK